MKVTNNTNNDDDARKKPERKKPEKKKPEKKKPEKSIKKAKDKISKKKSRRFELGDCPICHDKLGSKPLAATECGHVFCLDCLDIATDTNKYCPVCRNIIWSPPEHVYQYFPLHMDIIHPEE